jgi:thiol:disulfide interchange protein DsbD
MIIMTKIMQLIIILMLALGSSTFAGSINTTAATEINWQTYSDLPFDQAKKNNHLILLYAKSKSCHWCQKMDETAWHDPNLISYVTENFIPVLVDVDKDLELAMKYHVNSLPTIIILDEKNNIKKIFSGYFPPEYISANLKQIISPTAFGPEADIKAVTNPSSTELLLAKLPLDSLKKKQLEIFNEYSNGDNDLEKFANMDINTIDYALISASGNEKLAQQWLTSIFTYTLKLTDATSGGIYNVGRDGKIDYSKSTLIQANTIRLYAHYYRYWQNAQYIFRATGLINYINNTLTSSDGVFYAGVDWDAVKSMPITNKHIYPYVNGSVIYALSMYYMVTDNVTILNKAIKAAEFMRANYSIPGGGFRHEKNDNDKILLKDTLSMGRAYLSLYVSTQNIVYLEQAVAAATFIDNYFKNPVDKYGYISLLNLTSSSVKDLAISAQENAEIIKFTTLLYSYTGNKTVQNMQENALHYLSNTDVLNKLSPAVVLMTAYRVKNSPVHIVIATTKPDTTAKILFLAALAHAPIYSRIDLWSKNSGPLMNSDTDYQVMDKPVVYVCHGFQCSFPIYDIPDLITKLRELETPDYVELQNISDRKLENQFQFALDDVNAAENLLKKGNWLFTIMGFLGFGLLISFTPCILPLVPIMASIIVGNTIGVSKRKTFSLCLTYVVSMAFMYSFLGLIAGKFGLYLQIYLQGKISLILFSLIFLLLALLMLNDYELTIPNVIQNKIDKWSRLQTGGTFFGVMIMGVLSTLIISPCVTAPLLGALSFITKTGDYVLGAVGLFCMGIGMGIPLMIITLFSKNILPKAAHWNNQIKHFFGLVLLATSIWLISRVISETYIEICWSAFLILTTMYLGVFTMSVNTFFAKLWKTLSIMLFLFGLGLFADALFTSTDLYKALQLISTVRYAKDDELKPIFKIIKNKDDLQLAFDEAKQNHVPILLDFTASWCTACVKLDKDILSNRALSNIMSRYMLLKIDLSDINSESMAVASLFHVFGPPIILLINTKGQVFNLNLSNDMTVDQFKNDLQQQLEQSPSPGKCVSSL